MKTAPWLFLFFLLINLGNIASAQQANSFTIIPEPVYQHVNEGQFTITPSTPIIIQAPNDSLVDKAHYLASKLSTATWSVPDIGSKIPSDKPSIVLVQDTSSVCYFSDEAYSLVVSPDNITIKAPNSSGIFYGIQSLLQLLPPAFEYGDPTLVPQNIQWKIPSVKINDYPRFSYRGMHLDVARHFFPVSFIKKYIDLMSRYKMNRFHWHLTDDQGWRIEIKKYPKLTEIGGWRDSTLVGHYGTNRYDGQRYGGFYSQQDIKEIVQYAKKRHVTIIPEIEMPGHASAALAAYPELGCQPDKDYKVQTTWGVFDDIYCPNEKTFSFLEDVLTEVMELFPSKYIHIGGDEAPKTAWENSAMAQQLMKREGLRNEHELQSYFIRRIEKFLNKHDRKMIGWDEILEGGLAPNATVMSWRGENGGIEAAQQSHDVIMTPGTPLYLNFAQADPETEPLAQSEETFFPLKEVYSYEPIPDTLTRKESTYILGAQGNVWTEYIHSGRKVEYMAYPRALALAEVVWSPKNKRNWDDFLRRLQTHFSRLEIMDVHAAEHTRKKRNTK